MGRTYFLTSRPAPMVEGRPVSSLVRPVSPVVLGAYVVVVGLLALVGWRIDIPRLTDWTGTGLSLQPSSAVAAIAAGCSLIALACGWRRSGLSLALVSGAIGMVTLAEYVFGVDFHA